MEDKTSRADPLNTRARWDSTVAIPDSVQGPTRDDDGEGNPGISPIVGRQDDIAAETILVIPDMDEAGNLMDMDMRDTTISPTMTSAATCGTLATAVGAPGTQVPGL